MAGLWLAPVLGGRAAVVAAAAYATTLLPVVAANTLTPDGLLALFTTAAGTLYWRYRAASAAAPAAKLARWRWALLLALAVGLGMFTKGTAALVFAAPIVLHLVWEVGPLRIVRRPEIWLSLAVSLAAGLAWYLWIDTATPGALAYLYDNQVSGRLWEASYHRNTQWWQPVRVYGPALILGALPWSLVWIGIARRRAWRELERSSEAHDLFRFLLLAGGLPLVVLSLARSRLELYVLPLMAPLVVLTMLLAWRAGSPGARWPRRLLAAALAVVAAKAVGAYWHNPRDSRWLAAELERAGAGAESCVAVVDEAVHGLPFYGFSRVSWMWTTADVYPYFEAPPLLEPAVQRLEEDCRGPSYFLSEPHHLELARNVAAARGWTCLPPSDAGRYDIMSCRVPGAAGGAEP
jgi:4-amino-4-deoxy-L-arabinose transferase